MSYAPLDPKNTVMLFADLQAGIIELTCTNANTDQESPSRDARKVHRRERVLRFVLAASVDQGRTLTSSSTWLPATTIHLIAAEVHVPSRRPRHGFETTLAVQIIRACPTSPAWPCKQCGNGARSGERLCGNNPVPLRLLDEGARARRTMPAMRRGTSMVAQVGIGKTKGGTDHAVSGEWRAIKGGN